MNADVQADLVRRLETVERANRRLRVGLLAVVLGVGMTALVAAAQPGRGFPKLNAVHASAFYLYSEDGTKLAELSASEKSGQFILYRPDGQASVMLFPDVYKTGPRMSFYGPDNRTWLEFKAYETDKKGDAQPREPRLAVYNRKGEEIAKLPAK